jgi:hypothetical protein
MDKHNIQPKINYRKLLEEQHNNNNNNNNQQVQYDVPWCKE